jgi:hypothetical protein
MRRIIPAILAVLLTAISVPAFAQVNPTPTYLQPSVASPTAPGGISVQTATVGSSLVLKAAPGELFSATISNPSAAGFLLIFNAATVPADGTVTPVECVPVASAGTVTISYSTPEFFNVGMAMALSSTGCFTKTTAPTGFLHAQVQ